MTSQVEVGLVCQVDGRGLVANGGVIYHQLIVIIQLIIHNQVNPTWVTLFPIRAAQLQA